MTLVIVLVAVAVGVAVTLTKWSHRSTPASASGLNGKPNLLFILTDDQRWDSMEVMPKTRRIFNVNFREAIVTTPLCCPSRSSFLTGQYVHNTGVLTNQDYPVFKKSEAESLGPWLQRRGYYTGFVGKYFNQYETKDEVPPGWDEFHARVWNPKLKDRNSFSRFALREKWGVGSILRNEIVFFPNRAYPDAYVTNVFADIATGFLSRAADERYNPNGKPWALLVWPSAPNIPRPAPEYQNAPIPEWHRPPSFAERDLTDKPVEMRTGPEHNSSVSQHEKWRALQLRELLSVDDLVEQVFAAVDKLGVRSRTWSLYTSDNGRFYGEHGLMKKRYGYEEAIRVPFRMFVPGRQRATVDQLVANIDVAPTLLELAGDKNNHRFDGRSLLPLLESRSAWRRAVLIENWAPTRYEGLRTRRWKLIVWLPSRHVELYDLITDRLEMTNVARERPRTVQNLMKHVGSIKKRGP